MNLAISNIAWAASNDANVYALMQQYGFNGLEIAPTRIFPEAPYEKLTKAEEWSAWLKEKYGFVVPSMQSIWFGRQEKMFGSDDERKVLLDYTRKAIDFAAAIGCRNLVFGCPGNRNLPDGTDSKIAVEFFRELGDYAYERGTVIGMEANPPIYHTNYMNDTKSALELVREVNSRGFRLNLDVGTMIQNEEAVSELIGQVSAINHVHISEPGLRPIEERDLHNELKKVLEEGNYAGFISIEMGKTDDISVLQDRLQYIRSVFA